MKKILIILLSIFVLSSCWKDDNLEWTIQTNVNNNTTVKTEKIISKTEVQKYEKEILSINKINYSDKYNLECSEYTTTEWKNHCWETKIESHLFYLFRWKSWDEIYKIKCSEVFAKSKWIEVSSLSKTYIEKCEEVMKPHYKIYEAKLAQAKIDEEIVKESEKIWISACNALLKEKYADETEKNKAKILDKCRIWVVIKYDKKCVALVNSDEIVKCEEIKEDIDEYKRNIELQKSYSTYGNINLESFLKWEWK